jgi:hypothetical protein
MERLAIARETNSNLMPERPKENCHRSIAVIRGPDEMFDSAPRWEGVQRVADES